MKEVNAIVLRAAGINCDLETEYALTLAGARAQRLHINAIIGEPDVLEDCQILVFPGGFSYGDDVAAGKILANQVIHHLAEEVRKFIDAGKLVLGICNGFQVLVKAGILPGTKNSESRAMPAPSAVEGGNGQQVTITYNDSGKFEDRWVYLQPGTEKCVFIERGKRIYLPIAHGEGKVVTENDEILENLKSQGHIGFRYVDANGDYGQYPVNPNGSVDSIAGLTDTTGRVLGLMPHPERFVRHTQHPHWSRLKEPDRADGMTVFNNAVHFVKENL